MSPLKKLILLWQAEVNPNWLRHLGCQEAADALEQAAHRAINSKPLTEEDRACLRMGLSADVVAVGEFSMLIRRYFPILWPPVWPLSRLLISGLERALRDYTKSQVNTG